MIMNIYVIDIHYFFKHLANTDRIYLVALSVDSNLRYICCINIHLIDFKFLKFYNKWINNFFNDYLKI